MPVDGAGTDCVRVRTDCRGYDRKLCIGTLTRSEGLVTAKKTAAKLRLAKAAMGRPEIKMGKFSEETGIARQVLSRS